MPKYKVLLIDDNVDMLIIGKRIFERAGHDLLECRNAEDGLKTALVEKPDIIILDYMLPDMYGTDFIRIISNSSDYSSVKNTPIVILTARPNYIKELDECYAAGLKAFLHKPFGHRELVNVIENIVYTSQLQSAFLDVPRENQAGKMNSKDIETESEWFEDILSTSDALRGLCVDLKTVESENLSEEQLIELDAIYNSSSRLDKLLKKGSGKS